MSVIPFIHRTDRRCTVSLIIPLITCWFVYIYMWFFNHYIPYYIPYLLLLGGLSIYTCDFLITITLIIYTLLLYDNLLFLENLNGKPERTKLSSTFRIPFFSNSVRHYVIIAENCLVHEIKLRVTITVKNTNIIFGMLRKTLVTVTFIVPYSTC